MEAEVEQNGTGQIYGLMAQILSDVEAIGKGRRNEQQQYAFRGIDDVYNMVHPLMSKHQVFCVPRMLAQETSERITTSGSTLRFVQLSMAYDFFAPDGSHVTAEVMGEAMDAGDKASNKAMSAAHKYALLQTFCIPTGDVPDADYTTHPEITGERKSISKSSTATEQCPKCQGPCWDNREGKRNPKAPDYKCKNKACDGAIWLPKEAITEGYGTDQVLRDQYFNHAEKLMAGMDEADRKAALGRLLMLSTEEMGKKVDALAENVRKKQFELDGGTQMGHVEDERQRVVEKIREDVEIKFIDKYIAENYPGNHLSGLSLDALNNLYSDLYVPF